MPVSRGVLFCDVVGSMRLYRELGDRRAHAIVDACFCEIGRLIAECGGRVVKTIGDAVMAVFPDAPATCDAAVAIQKSLGADAPCRPAGGEGVRFRIGFHWGPVVLSDGDVFGTTVNVAARVAALAKAEQIVTTTATIEHLRPPQRTATRMIAAARARGLTDDVTVAEVIWQVPSIQQTVVFALSGAAPAAAPAGVLKIAHDGGRRVFDGSGAGITLGRDAENTIMVGVEAASRRHATIERRSDRWVLIDHSTNGTFVRPVGAPEFRICREELILHAAGSLGLGRSLDHEAGLDFVLSSES